MIPVVSDQPYRFVPPSHGLFWLRRVTRHLPGYLRRSWGIEQIEYRGWDRVEASRKSGHGVMLAPNHARPCDPFVIGMHPLRQGWPCYFVAAWHVFTTSGRVNRWLLPRVGAFSINRWGMDRESLKTSIEILTAANRPLLLFPEGMITRSNDRVVPLMEGTAFLARTAARHRNKQSPAGSVVIHPVAIRYAFQGDLDRAVGPVLESIERRLGWQMRHGEPLIERVERLGLGLLSLKEIEYLGCPQTGDWHSRLTALTEAVLLPLEREWLGQTSRATVVERVKAIRTAILPGLVENRLDAAERSRRWRHLADCYLAQQFDCYPPEYLARPLTVDRILETVERFDEDLTDVARIHRPLNAVVEYGEPIAVEATKDRDADERLTFQLETQLRAMVESLRVECRPYPG